MDFSLDPMIVQAAHDERVRQAERAFLVWEARPAPPTIQGGQLAPPRLAALARPIHRRRVVRRRRPRDALNKGEGRTRGSLPLILSQEGDGMCGLLAADG